MKSGAGLPAGTYSTPRVGSSVKLLHKPPPVRGTAFGPLAQVRAAAPVSGTTSNFQRTLPVPASSAYTRPVTPMLSPPELPTKTIPFQAIGAIGAPSPLLGSPNATSHNWVPSAA